jgi:FKBP-type peptidyl-prolyl cis-trans isomerase
VRGGLALLVIALTLLVGCGSDSAPESTGIAEPTTPTLSAKEQARADARAAREERIRLERTFVPNPWPEPGTTAPHDKPLTRLIVHEVKRGSGPALTGKEVAYVDYVKTFWRSGQKFLVAWGPLRAEYLDLPSQAPGMRRGMIGMRVGGRRTIAMPKSISDVHPPDGSGRFTAAQVDVVVRKIVTE